MSDIRALTIRQPWAGAIAAGEKHVENRTWRTHYRGPLLIHAASQTDRDAQLPPGAKTATDMPLGAIIAIAELTDCHYDDMCCGAWAQCEVWHWLLDDVQLLPEPIPCKGSLGLWRPNPKILAEVNSDVPL